MNNDKAPYGYCPICGASGVARERRPNGDDECANGHTYPSSASVGETSSCEAKTSTHNLDLDAIEARAKRATKGPWTRGFDKQTEEEVIIPTGFYGYGKSSANAYADGDFICASRTDVPALVARVRELDDDNAALRLAATELYELVTHGCGFDPEYGVIARMAQVLGVKDGQEPTE